MYFPTGGPVCEECRVNEPSRFPCVKEALKGDPDLQTKSAISHDSCLPAEQWLATGSSEPIIIIFVVVVIVYYVFAWFNLVSIANGA